MARWNLSLADRFMSKVEPEPNTGCWLWTGALASAGYGALGIGKRTAYAHRVSYELFVGPIPDGMCVLHRCDARSCVSPDHLFLGTKQDNSEDMGRKRRGTTSRQGMPSGVYINKGRVSKPFYAQVQFHSITHCLGTFSSASAASEAVEKHRASIYAHTVVMQDRMKRA